MSLRPAALAASISAALALSGCASDKESYPSLAIRPAERATATFQPPQPAPAPPPLSTDMTGQVTQLRAAAADADRRFQAAAAAARAPVNAGRGAEPGSEAWSVAQIALSDAVARHNEAVAALGGLDQIQVAAQTEGSALGEIGAAVNEVAAQVQAQNAVLDELQAGAGG